MEPSQQLMEHLQVCYILPGTGLFLASMPTGAIASPFTGPGPMVDTGVRLTG